MSCPDPRELFALLNRQIATYPPRVEPVPDQILGTSFFPGGTGLWYEGTTDALPSVPVGGVMIVGHDFHSKAGYEWSRANQQENLRTPTWRHLLALLDRVPLSPKDCFFTNAYMGLRTGKATTGKFPGASNVEFVDACRRFFLEQLAMQRPRVVLALGQYVPGFLAPLAPQLSRWAASGGSKFRDREGISVVSGVVFEGSPEPIVAVSLVHPSYWPLNVQSRRWKGSKAEEAEVQMVREALALAGIRSEAPRRVRPLQVGPELIIESAIRAVEGMLHLDILPRHKRELISAMIWKITEARGKYTTRYQSVAARSAGPDVKRHHDHVVTRADMIASIIDDPRGARRILETALACVVTADEHERLTEATRRNPSLKGWARYHAARVAVFDSTAERELDLDAYAPVQAERPARARPGAIPRFARQALLSIGRAAFEGRDPDPVWLERVKGYPRIYALHPDVWHASTADLSNAEVGDLACGMTYFEEHVGRSGGSVDSVIWIFRELVARGPAPKEVDEVSAWILRHTSNPYNPFGTQISLGARDYSEFKVRSAARDRAIEQQVRRDETSDAQAKAERQRRKDMAAAGAAARSLPIRAELIQALNAMPITEKLAFIARHETYPPQFFPTSVAYEAKGQIVELPRELRVELARRLKGRRRGPWMSLRKELIRSLGPIWDKEPWPV